ncbi:MAG: glycoside hydrolase family 130 protein [Phycisphaerae bacterium]|nr:glycoside hydrolase family 130 protein [Phycisphaerae bacterium]
MIKRLFNACLLRPEDLKPSHDELEVVGTFNPGAIDGDGEVVILVRVAERPRERREGFTGLPRWRPDSGLTIDWVPSEELTPLDPRVVERKRDGLIRLNFISHLRVVRSKDGRSVDSIDGATFTPATAHETFGVEDPRITRIGDTFYFTYVSVSSHGACTSLASTKDFETFKRHGVIFPSENKDVVLFPEKIGDDYVALHRPNAATPFCTPEMWLARSPDLIHWGRNAYFLGGESGWQTGRIGAGTPPIRTDEGWLEIYHGNRRPTKPGDVGVYSAGAVLLDTDDPSRIVRHTDGAVMEPEADYEREGFVPNVVFPTGIVDRGDVYQVYYGAADAFTGVVEFSKRELLAALK